MSLSVCFLMIAAFAAAITRPFMAPGGLAPINSPSEGDELWVREKGVALLAIKEAEFDHATGKLSESDYDVLKTDYEGRALTAIDQIEKGGEVAAGDTSSAETAARFCTSCGNSLSPEFKFCSSCGKAAATA